MVETPDIILFDPDNKSQKLVRGRSEKKVEITKHSTAPVMKDTKSSGGGGKSGGSQLKKSSSVKTKKNASGLGARSKSVNAPSKKANDPNAAEEADMEAAIMAQLELTLAGKTDSLEEFATEAEPPAEETEKLKRKKSKKKKKKSEAGSDNEDKGDGENGLPEINEAGDDGEVFESIEGEEEKGSSAARSSFKKSTKKFKVGSLATSAVTSIKSKEDKYRFKVFFKNDIDVPINVYWIDYKGKEVEKKARLPPQEVYSTHTFFTHHWIFRKSDGEDKAKLLADANAIQNLIFEGEKFLAVPNEKIEVYVCENNGEPDIEQQPEEDDSKGESKRKITPNGLENGIKGAIKEKTSEDIEKERKKKLMEMGCEAFMFTIRKRNRLQDPKNPRHRWFRWKDREDLEEEAKKSSKWLDDDDEGACGFAIGRRIFEKAEIEDTVIDPRRSRTRDNYNLRDAKEDFRLWDRVHGRDVLKHLEQVSKWEPGKKERERRERAEALLAKQKAEEASNSGEGLGGIQEEGSAEATIEEFAAIKAKKKAAEKKKKGTIPLPAADLQFCLTKTNLDKPKISQWYKCFSKECPDNNMNRQQLEGLFVKIFPVGDSKAFCDHIFRIFDDDKSNTIEFKEFIMAIAVTQLHSERDKLAWAFRLYDIDASGTINVTEMQNIIETLDQIEGRTPSAVDEEDPNSTINSAASRAAEIFGPLDVDKDGEITMDEFVDGYMKIHTLSNGKRRWSRKASMFQQVSEEDLEKLRLKMDSALAKPASDNTTESKDNKDRRVSNAKLASNEKAKEEKSEKKPKK